MPLHRYRFGGLNLRSNVELRGARRPVDDASAGIETVLTFRTDPPPVPGTILHGWGGRYELRLARSGDDWLFDSRLDGSFLLDRSGASLQVHCRSLPPTQEVIDVLLRRVLPRATLLTGKVAIHAAAAARDDGAVLLVGSSGAGKSTTAAYLVARAGWHGLGEDYTILADPDSPVVEPGPTGVCVWPDMRDGLDLPREACEVMPGAGGKIRFEPPEAPPLPAPRLKALVALERTGGDEAPSVEPLSRGEAFIAATRQLVLFDPSTNLREELGVQMARANAILRTVPAYRLRYPANPGALPQTAALLENLVR